MLGMEFHVGIKGMKNNRIFERRLQWQFPQHF